jgi:hypothetical protein
MASGRVELASTGIQDTFITEGPQVTFFQKQFKKHTQFALDTLDNGVDGTPDFGNRITCVIPRKGHLIKTMYLKVKLPQLYEVAQDELDHCGCNIGGVGSSSDPQFGYTDSIGHALIEHADLIIGGQLVQRITGEYMEIVSEFFISDSHQSSLAYTVGKTGTKLGLGPANDTYGVYGSFPREFMIPLPFYFHNNPSLAIPLCAIDKQEVEVHIKFRKLDELYVTPVTNTTSTVTGTIESVSLAVEYVYITPDEINYIKNRPTDYVISQLQLARTSLDENMTTSSFKLNFTNPVKELFFVLQTRDKLRLENDIFNFTNSDDPSGEHLESINLMFNNEDRISNTVATSSYLKYIQPMTYHTRTPTRNIYSYSFALKPENSEPTGQVNMSRIINKILTVNTKPSTKIRDLRIYAVNYNVLRVHCGLAGVIFNENESS